MASTNIEDSLTSRGAIGARMRSMDWSQTALGPVEGWPQSLRSALSICLGSGFPIAIYWGPQLTLIYNDAWSPIPGTKHPWALGRQAREVWPEIWPTIGPLFEQVMERGEGTYSEDSLLPMFRHGYTEECYFNFTFTPIRGDGGRVEGVFNAVIETTFRVVSDRRTQLLRQLGDKIASARSADEACSAAAISLGQAASDVPFCALYLVDDGAASARLAAITGLAASGPATPARIDLSGPGGPWLLGEARASRRVTVVSNLRDRFGVSFPGGTWPEPADSALVAPLLSGGDIAGFVILGANPRRAIDDEYRSFAERVASLIATTVANANAWETERKRAAALEELDRAKTTFFSNVSHEFRTPLTLMLGPTEEALASGERALTGAALETVYRNELRLLRLVNNLLDFSRIEAGRTKAVYEPIDLAALTVDLASAFRSAIERGGLRFEVDCPSLPEPVYVDRALWETIVLNLLSNAFKFTLRGMIRVQLHERAGQAVLEVTDTGVGIPAHELPRMFDRFHRVEVPEARTDEGSGIGLAFVKELVELHGGAIAIESTEAVGSTFRVSIPLGRAHMPPEQIAGTTTQVGGASRAEPFVQEALRWVEDSSSPRTDEAASGPALSKPSETDILIADDNADMRDYLARILGQQWRVETAADGLQALEAIERGRPDLVLTDVMMPKLDGFGLLGEIRRRPALARTRVILLSARAGEDSRVEGLDAGADDYLVKPFAAKELMARVRSHLENARERRTISTERARLRMLLGQLPAIVNFLRGPDLIIEYAHPMTIQTLGGRALVGRPLLEAIPEFRDQEYPALLRQVLETGKAIDGRERLVKIADGVGGMRDTFWNFVYLPMRDAQGRVEGVMTFDLDVSENVLARKKIEQQAAELVRAIEEARSARAVAEAANRAKDEFLAMLGHELRNPLSPILTALQLMRIRKIETREQEVIERQVGYLVRLVDDLLDISRITRGKIELRRQTIELASAVAAGLEMARPLLEQRRQKVNLDVPMDGLLLHADPDRLAQIISNLLTNAAKYSDPESEVHVTARLVGTQVRLSVLDEGVGLPLEIVDRVFDPFFQQPQAIDRSKGGLGIGLAIVRNLAEMHNGRVFARSEGVGKGSEFVVELPAVSGTPVRHALSSSGEAGTSRPRSADHHHGRILVVDDNADAADTLVELLSDLGYATKATYDAHSALELAQTFLPDLCLLDIGLPVVTGYELAERLRQIPNGKSLRLVALTGYGQESDRRRALAAGFDEHLTKPVGVEALKSVLALIRPTV